MHSKNTTAFTLIELVVAATILVILTSIWFYSYVQNIADARDGVRKTDIASLWSQLSLYKKQRWALPFPGDYFSILNQWWAVAYQWRMNNNVSLSTAEKLPLDPEMEIPYFYSTTINRQEYQIALSLENADDPYALLEWSYKSVAKDVLPTIVLASENTWDLEISSPSSTNPARDLFIYDNGFHNIPYDFEDGTPLSDGTDFDTLQLDAWDDFWQNTDFRSCTEIFEAAKWVTPSWDTDTYQILSSTWSLSNTWCTAP